MDKVRCAIVGLGRIGSLLEEDRLREKPCTHAGAIVQNRDCLLIAGCDIDAERRALFSRKWGCRVVFAKLEEMLQRIRPDILTVATPIETHLELIEKAIPHRVRLVICEKPLAENSRDARRLAALREEAGLRILVNHERRYSLDYLRAKRHIEEHVLGALLSITARLYMGRATSVYDMLLHDGTHLVDMVNFLTSSRLEMPSARKVTHPGGESLLIEAGAGPVPVLMEIGSGRDHLVFELDLSFEQGRIRVGNGLYEEYSSAPSPYYQGWNSLKKGRKGRPRRTGYFANMMADAVRCIRQSERIPVSSAADGLAALEFIDAVKGLRAKSA